LGSIINQSHLPNEIIVVDDGSADDTKSVVESYAEYGVIYARLPVGKGAQAARNYGIMIANYEWIAFQDSDDVWLPEKLAKQVDVLRAHNYDKCLVVHGDALRLDEATGTETYINIPLTSGRCYEKLLVQAAPMFPSLLASKQALMGVGGFDVECHAYQEWDAAIRLSRENYFVHIQSPLFVWIWHGGETISKDRRRDILGFDHVINSNKSEIIRSHNLGAWRKLKAGNVARAILAGLWDDAKAMIVNEGTHPCFVLARLFINCHFRPPGVGRFLQTLSTIGKEL